MVQQLYDDVNDLYTDEHRLMAQADLLEQMQSLLHEVHMVARDRPLVVEKRHQEATSTETAILDPDKFPIQRLSADLVKEHQSLWEA